MLNGQTQNINQIILLLMISLFWSRENVRKQMDHCTNLTRIKCQGKSIINYRFIKCFSQVRFKPHDSPCALFPITSHKWMTFHMWLLYDWDIAKIQILGYNKSNYISSYYFFSHLHGIGYHLWLKKKRKTKVF